MCLNPYARGTPSQFYRKIEVVRRGPNLGHVLIVISCMYNEMVAI